MLGTNPKLPPVKGTGDRLDITEIFATIQGEGPFTGHPAIFIRLSGCNLACSFCDTAFDQATPMQLEEIVTQIELLASNKGNHQGYNLVVITGGEPLRQPIAPLCERLLEKGFQVQIETNGTIFRPLPKEVHIVCSPKPVNGRYHLLHPAMLEQVDALKFIISTDLLPYQEIGEVGQSSTTIPIYVQPMDEQDAQKNAANLAYTIALAKERAVRISLQTHKIMKID